MILRDLIGTKSGELQTIDAHATIEATIKKLCDHKIGSLLVMGQDGSLQGIITERDVLRETMRSASTLGERMVGEVMTCGPILIGADASLEDAMRVMTERRVRHLPVMDNDRVLGMLSIGDVVKNLLDEQKESVKTLTEYITAH